MEMLGNGANTNYLALGCTAVFLLFCIRGYQKGFIREIVSTFFVVLALGIVWIVNPYVNQFLQQQTPCYKIIQEKCQEAFSEQAAGEEGISAEILDVLPLPEALKEGIADNNSPEIYQFLAVDTFSEYLSSYLARTLCNGISFLLSYLLVTILIRSIVSALDLLARLPVLRGINKLAGILVGGIRGILFIWVGFLIITIFCNTSWGSACVRMIGESPLLQWLYRQDIFVRIFMNIFYGSNEVLQTAAGSVIRFG